VVGAAYAAAMGLQLLKMVLGAGEMLSAAEFGHETGCSCRSSW
jgi:hypothetical protein